MSIGTGVMILIATTAIYFLLAAPGPAAQRSTIAAAPGASAPAAPGTTPVPRISVARWLHGLRLLDTHMNPTDPGKSQFVTPALLRSQARQLSRCSPELADLGPPAARLEPAYRLAARACGKFGQAASCYAAASRAFNPNDVSTQYADQLNCGNADTNSAIELIDDAAAVGSGYYIVS